MDKITDKTDTTTKINAYSNRHSIYLRFSKTEYDKLHEMSLKTGKKKTDILREAYRLNNEDVFSGITRFEYRKLIAQINKLGTNLNQISRVANSRGYLDHIESLNNISDSLIKMREYFLRGLC